MWLDARERHRCRRKHPDDLKAQNDIIGKVHNVVPAMPKVVCTRAINVTEQRDRTPLPPPWSVENIGSIPTRPNKQFIGLTYQVTAGPLGLIRPMPKELTCRECAATVRRGALRCHVCGTLCPTLNFQTLVLIIPYYSSRNAAR
jgi:RNA polymerase subunit RPABC4/transcription elongation factor Spt4